MSNEQKLLHVALEAINALMMGAERYSDNHWGRICMPTDSAMSKGADAAMAISQAIATTEPEPEPTGRPELPEPDHMVNRWPTLHVYTSDQMLTYGEQCWKAGYKHGAWGDKPAVNQQLTTEPFDERGAFENEMSCEEIWGHRSLKKKPDGRYANWCVDLMWDVWKARAAMAQVGGINVVDPLTDDTKDAERYRWLASSESNAMDAKSQDHQWAISDAWTTLQKPGADKALIDAAIDAAMAQGVKG